MTGLAGARILGRLGLTLMIALLLYFVVYRPLQLRWGASPGEVARPMPGDEIQPRPIFDATRAISIDAPPERIWPWLVQIGYRRAGWYSGLDWLDNDGVPSADHILPGLQHLAAGDPLPVWRDITHRVVAVEPGRYLLAASASGQDSWLWALVPEGAALGGRARRRSDLRVSLVAAPHIRLGTGRASASRGGPCPVSEGKELRHPPVLFRAVKRAALSKVRGRVPPAHDLRDACGVPSAASM